MRSLALVGLLVASIAAQPCTNNALEAYQRCVTNNPCQCANCDPDPSDDDPQIVIVLPETCQDITRVICPLVRCCEPCEEFAATFYSCSSNAIANQFVGTDCPLTCLGFDYNDGSCGTTDPPLVETDPPVATDPPVIVNETSAPVMTDPPVTDRPTISPVTSPTMAPVPTMAPIATQAPVVASLAVRADWAVLWWLLAATILA